MSMPAGLLAAWVGLRGGLIDAGYPENVLAGLVLLVLGLVPPAKTDLA